MADEVFPWLPVDDVLAWLKISDAAGTNADAARDCRTAAAEWIEAECPDYFTGTPLAPKPAYANRVVLAGLMGTARLYARRDSPGGVVSFAEFGAASVLSGDADVERLLRIGRYAPPRVG